MSKKTVRDTAVNLFGAIIFPLLDCWPVTLAFVAALVLAKN